MDYKEKYKQALERASKTRVQNPFDTVGQMVEHIFPELKEKEFEDERMKKAIIHILYENYTDAAVIDGVEIAEIVAWLEKQGEKNINHIDIKEKAHQIAWEVSKDYDPLLSKESWCEMAALDMASWLEKQSKKKSADEVLKIRQELYQSGYNDGYKHGQEDLAKSLGKESIEALVHFVRSIGESDFR